MRVPVLLVLASLWLAALCGPVRADFHPGVKIEADGNAIDVRIGHLKPWVTDWNADGKKDLILGQFMGGKVRVYLNEGTDRSPVFKRYSFLNAGGKVISLAAG